MEQWKCFLQFLDVSSVRVPDKKQIEAVIHL